MLIAGDLWPSAAQRKAANVLWAFAALVFILPFCWQREFENENLDSLIAATTTTAIIKQN